MHGRAILPIRTLVSQGIKRRMQICHFILFQKWGVYFIKDKTVTENEHQRGKNLEISFERFYWATKKRDSKIYEPILSKNIPCVSDAWCTTFFLPRFEPCIQAVKLQGALLRKQLTGWGGLCGPWRGLRNPL